MQICISDFKQALSGCGSQSRIGFCQVSAVTLMNKLLSKCKKSLLNLLLLHKHKPFVAPEKTKNRLRLVGYHSLLIN